MPLSVFCVHLRAWADTTAAHLIPFPWCHDLIQGQCVLLHGLILLLHTLNVDQLSIDLFSEKRCKNICTPSETQGDTLMYRLVGGSTGSFSSSSCAWSLSAGAVKLQRALNCLSQTCCSKAFPSLPKFNWSLPWEKCGPGLWAAMCMLPGCTTESLFYSQGEDVQLHWNSRWWCKFQWCGLLADEYSSKANSGSGVRVTLWLSRLSTIWEIWIEKWKIAQSLAHAAVSLSPLFIFSPARAPFSSAPLHCACGCMLMAICQCLVRRGGVCPSLTQFFWSINLARKVKV